MSENEESYYVLHVDPQNSRLKNLLYTWSHPDDKHRNMSNILVERLGVNMLLLKKTEDALMLSRWLQDKEKKGVVRIFEVKELKMGSHFK